MRGASSQSMDSVFGVLLPADEDRLSAEEQALLRRASGGAAQARLRAARTRRGPAARRAGHRARGHAQGDAVAPKALTGLLAARPEARAPGRRARTWPAATSQPRGLRGPGPQLPLPLGRDRHRGARRRRHHGVRRGQGPARGAHGARLRGRDLRASAGASFGRRASSRRAHGLSESPLRFDVVSIDWHGREPQIRTTGRIRRRGALTSVGKGPRPRLQSRG